MRGASWTSSTATATRSLAAHRRVVGGRGAAFLLGLTVAAAIVARPASAHGLFPDFVAGTLVVGDGALEGRIIVLPELFDQWSGHARPEPRSMGPGEAVVLQADAAAILGSALTVEIDGVLVRGVYDLPSILSVPHNERQVEYLAFPVRFPLVAPPQRIGMVWSRWEGFPGAALDLVIFGVEDALAKRDLIFQEHEPEAFWTRPRPPGEAVGAVAAAPGTPDRPAASPGGVTHAVVSRTFLLSGLVAIVAAWRRWRRARAYPAVAAATLMACGLGLIAIRQDAAQAVPPAPDAVEGRAIFEALQSNVYRAFAYKRDVDVYDALAQSVGGALLDRVYIDVYQGLVMEDGGGARSRVDRVEYLEVSVAPQDTAGGDVFRVASRWRVHGAVAHWGHEHRRVVEHVARFTIGRDASGWRIIHVETTEMPRVVVRTVSAAGSDGSRAMVGSGSGSTPPR